MESVGSMKVTYQFLDGRQKTSEFASIEEFLRQQNLEVPAIEDSAKVVELVIDGQTKEFKGSVLDLWNELNK